MDIISELDLANGSEIALIAFLIGILTQGIKKTGKVNSDLLPFISMAIGVIAGLVACYYCKDTNYLGGALAGLIVGATTSGAFGVLKSGTSLVSDKVSTSKDAKKKARQDEIDKAVADALAAEKLKEAAKVDVESTPAKPVTE